MNVASNGWCARWVLVHCGPYKENKKTKGRRRGMALYFLHEILANLQKQKLLAKLFLYPLLLKQTNKKQKQKQKKVKETLCFVVVKVLKKKRTKKSSKLFMRTCYNLA
jgi:hypothetical protein